MRTANEVLNFIDEQLGYLESIAKDEGLKKPLLLKVSSNLTQERLDQNYRLYATLKQFIKEEIE